MFVNCEFNIVRVTFYNNCCNVLTFRCVQGCKNAHSVWIFSNCDIVVVKCFFHFVWNINIFVSDIVAVAVLENNIKATHLGCVETIVFIVRAHAACFDEDADFFSCCICLSEAKWISCAIWCNHLIIPCCAWFSVCQPVNFEVIIVTFETYHAGTCKLLHCKVA